MRLRIALVLLVLALTGGRGSAQYTFPFPLSLSLSAEPGEFGPAQPISLFATASSNEEIGCQYCYYNYGLQIVGSDGFAWATGEEGWSSFVSAAGMSFSGSPVDGLPAQFPMQAASYEANAYFVIASELVCGDGCYWFAAVGTAEPQVAAVQPQPDPCNFLPYTETSTYIGPNTVPGSDSYTLAAFRGNLLSLSGLYSYAGRRVGEFNYREYVQNPELDTCYYDGSSISPQLDLGESVWPVSAQDTYETDDVGWVEVSTSPEAIHHAVLYYRLSGRAPCQTTFYQDMAMQCNDGTWTNYKYNVLRLGINSTTVWGERDGVRSPKKLLKYD